MRKVIKYLLALIGVGAAAGFLYAYFTKNENEEAEEVDFDLSEEEDFDLDSDLEPVTNREYVTLNPQAKPSEEVPEVTEEVASEND